MRPRCRQIQRHLAGDGRATFSYRRVKEFDGGDNDTKLEITPRADFAGLLTNRYGRDNQPQDGQDPVIECEVNVGSDWRSQYEFFVNRRGRVLPRVDRSGRAGRTAGRSG